MTKRLQKIAGGKYLSLDSLLTTKLTIPPARPHSLPRPRLIHTLDLALQSQLTLVSAPAGFGKTTLLSEWCRDRGFPVSWVSLDNSDNDPMRFWRYVIAALTILQPGLAELSLATFQSPQPPPIEPLLTNLVNELSTSPTDLVLILDDYHVIHDQTIHKALTFLLDHLPQCLHLVIASRADPPFPLARWRAGGQLSEIHAAQLRFLTDEVAALMNAAGLNMSAEDIAALQTRTEGWVAGLQLAALSLQGRNPVEMRAFVRDLTGSNRYIMDYLMEEVLAHQPEHIQTFLLQTSILDLLTGTLCDAVVDQNLGLSGSSQSILESLDGAKLFIVPLDEERRWYRYHHLFADLLRHQLHQLQPNLVAELHRRAAEWYERADLVSEAVRHALASSEVEMAARLIEQNGRMLLGRGEVNQVLDWLKALPEEVMRSRPKLSILHARALLIAGPWEAIEPRLQQAERQLQSNPNHLIPSETQEVLGTAAALRGIVASTRGDLLRAITLSQEALQRLSSDDRNVRSIVFLNLGAAYELSGNLVQASHSYEEASRLGQAGGNLQVAFMATQYLAKLQIMQGKLHLATNTCQRAVQLAVGPSGKPLPVAGMAYVVLGDLMRERNDLEGASRYLSLGIDLCQQWGNPEVLAEGYAVLARVQLAQGNLLSAVSALEQAMEQMSAHDIDPRIVAYVSNCQVWMQLSAGDLPAANRWLSESGLKRDNALTFQREAEFILAARVHITHGRRQGKRQQITEALSLLDGLLRAADAGGRKGRVIEILLLQAMANQALRNRREALQNLEQALVLAEPESYIRVFLDEGPPMKQLLQEAQASGKFSEYASQLLAASADTKGELRNSSISGLEPEAFVESLTERELEVLRLIAGGLSNSQIAQSLTISVGTAKRHINNLYGKLNVRSRTQAIVRARELHLL